MKILSLVILSSLSSLAIAKSNEKSSDRCAAVVEKFAEASSLSLEGVENEFSWKLLSETFERTYEIRVNDWSHFELVLSNDSASTCVFESLKFKRDID